MDRILNQIDKLFVGAVAAAMGIVIVTVIGDVIGRYVFNSALVWANELSRLGFVWMTFMVMPLGVARALHVAITSVVDNLPPFPRRIVFRAGVAATVALMVVVLAGAWISIGARSSEMLNTLPLSAAAFFWPVAIGACWTLVHLIVQFLKGEPPIRDLSDQTARDLP